ncbi:MAG TPA: hypothetical protein VF153_05460 [Candidatus Limnocylindria bacterium]
MPAPALWLSKPCAAFSGGDYEIRIKGRLSDALLAAFEGLTATVDPVETVLYGPVPDQSSLHGLLRPPRPAGSASACGASKMSGAQRFPSGCSRNEEELRAPYTLETGRQL